MKTLTQVNTYKKSKLQYRDQVQAHIVIDYNDFQRYKHLVNLALPNEVQWFCTVDREISSKNSPSEKSKNYTGAETDLYYLVSDLFIPNQTVHGAEADTDPMQMFGLYQELKEKYRLINEETGEDLGVDKETVNNIVSKMHVWCHSHPFNSTSVPSPSGQDESNFRDWYQNNLAQNLDTPTIMLIFGKNDAPVFARVFDPMYPDFQFYNVPVHITSPPAAYTEDIDEMFKEKVTVKARENMYRSYSPGMWGGHGWTTTNGVYSRSQSKNPNSGIMPESTEDSNDALDKMIQSAFNDLIRKEGKAFKVFQKQTLANLADTFYAINTDYDVTSESQEIYQILCKWLKTNDEWMYFFSAAFEKETHIKSLENHEANASEKYNAEYCLTRMVEELGSCTITATELKEAMTFAKILAKKSMENKAGREFSIKRLLQKQHEFTECLVTAIWGEESNTDTSVGEICKEIHNAVREEQIQTEKEVAEAAAPPKPLQLTLNDLVQQPDDVYVPVRKR